MANWRMKFAFSVLESTLCVIILNLIMIWNGGDIAELFGNGEGFQGTFFLGYTDGFLLLAWWLLIFTILLMANVYSKQVSDFIYRMRYPIALILLVILVVNEISGSSIGSWELFMPQDADNSGVLFGTYREIRSDEWAVNTSLAFAQTLYKDSYFPYFNDAIRATGTDMFIVYGQAVLNFVVLFRPFLIGYLFLGAAKGLSFFWCSRWIALAMVSFEFGMFITKKKRRLSVLYAILIILSPVVQWWFAINGFVEMLIFGQLAVLFFQFYMHTEKYWMKILLALGIVWCAGSFGLTLYPAWEIPMAYVIITWIIWCIWEYHREFIFNIKKDIPIIISAGVLLGLVLLYIVFKSQDTIDAVLNTVYPGKRMNAGGPEPGENALNILMGYASNLFVPLLEDKVIWTMKSNPSEISRFLSLFPMGFILSVYLWIKEKSRDKFLICFNILAVFFGIFCLFPWPEKLAKISLLSNSFSGRVSVVWGYCNLLILIRALSLVKGKMKQSVGWILALVSAIWITFCAYIGQQEYYRIDMLLITFLVIFILFAACLLYRRGEFSRVLLWGVLIVSLISGGIVNPIQKGIDIVYKNELVQSIEGIVEQDSEAVWITEGMSFPLIEIPMLAGAKILNCTNAYPNMDFWNQIDPEGTHEGAYNRYAHISIMLKEKEEITQPFVLEGADVFIWTISKEELKKTGARYILSPNDLERFSDESIRITRIGEVQGYKIYSVEY